MNHASDYEAPRVVDLGSLEDLTRTASAENGPVEHGTNKT
jgi:hypothetical protein